MSGVRGDPDYADYFSKAAEVWTESMVGRLICVMDWASFIPLSSFMRSWAEQERYQAVIQPERILSMVHL